MASDARVLPHFAKQQLSGAALREDSRAAGMASLYHCGAMLTTLSLSVKHLRSDREQPCGACGARFVPSEDSGSRVFSIKAPEQDAFSAIMCGGCYSKWSYGTTMTVRGGTAA